jgi:hypothetical protein
MVMPCCKYQGIFHVLPAGLSRYYIYPFIPALSSLRNSLAPFAVKKINRKGNTKFFAKTTKKFNEQRNEMGMSLVLQARLRG